MALLGQRRQNRPAKKRVLQSSAPASGPVDDTRVRVERLSHDGRGIARHADGKTIFIDRVLPGESVAVAVHHSHRRFDEAHPRDIADPSSDRITPVCPHFGVCGGCDLQHLAHAAQRRHKADTLGELFARHQMTLPEPEILDGDAIAYRRRARLGVRVDRDGQVIMGFRKRGTDRLFAVSECPVLVPSLQALLAPMKTLLDTLDAPRHVGHVMLVASDDGVHLTVRLLRAVASDEARWQAFASVQGLHLELLKGREAPLVRETVTGSGSGHYLLDIGVSEPLSIGFENGDFLQANAEVNQAMVSRLLAWCGDVKGRTVVDFFAGIGNFSLPLAARGARVIALEGQAHMVNRLSANAARAVPDGNVEARQADLSRPLTHLPDADLAVLDPPRAGAEALCRQLATDGPERIVYISCDPATLARDVVYLMEGGYQLQASAMADMFPQTAHLESMVLLAR
ncbi:23S rRNA (uracil(1939)-C(5))-methyltransferase RlmD [Larsenimonas rhizosphaerae]|uniref:23S rRNA (uracil(1939)-C(5))-methyltransferase RlmD n=1 Tax=Larsenimonas rhizosphaerae TaxID=2944682 RepID=UPI002033284C|nr:23S rRNA (uracil(1939)-C(5))-methyltransferase RlmD [Larsenimonas rhizosphaerae]